MHRRMAPKTPYGQGQAQAKASAASTVTPVRKRQSALASPQAQPQTTVELVPALKKSRTAEDSHMSCCTQVQ